MKYFTISNFIILLVTYFSYITYESELQDYDTNLDVDGFLYFDRHLNKNELLQHLPKKYVFLNYKYEIKGKTLSTFHRDVTSSQYIFNTKYPIYTYITYYNPGKVLSLCPGSHKQTPFLFNRPKILNSHSNHSSVLFNCDVVHAGYLNYYPNYDRHAIQYKLVHYYDLLKLTHLYNIHKTTNTSFKSYNYYYELTLRKLSLFFSYIVNHVFTKYLQNNQNNSLSNIVMYLTNKDFYNK